mmetsp:Transcript_1032/g.2653  ORF Transcript_1032/g.2653 Transcript_1032/m.2653 type:complete len:498 (+) Transcript_1032:624-2117(+)
MQAAHQHADEAAVETVLALGAELADGLGRERDGRALLAHLDVGAVAAQVGVGREVGHLAHRGALAQRGHQPPLAEDLDLALRNDVKAVAFLAALEEGIADRVAFPARAAHHLPELHVAEFGEEFQRAQQREALRVAHLAEAVQRHLLAGHQAGQGLGEALPVGEAVMRRLGQRAQHDRVQRLADTLALAHQRQRRLVVDLVHQRHLVRRIEGRPATDQVVEHRTQRIDVGPAVDVAALDLLRRHIGQRADAVDLGRVGMQVQRRAEVADLDIDHLAVVQHRQQVGRLHVAVDDALAEHIAQRHRALETEFDDLVQGQQAVAAAEMLQRDARHILHHQIGRRIFRDRIEDGDDVGMVQSPGQRRLGTEEAAAEVAAGGVGRGCPGAHALDRDLLALEGVTREKDVAGRALTEALEHQVASDMGRQIVGKSGHGGHDTGGHCRAAVAAASFATQPTMRSGCREGRLLKSTHDPSQAGAAHRTRRLSASHRPGLERRGSL